MDKNRVWRIGSVLIMVLVLVGGVLLGIQPQLAQAAAADAERATVEASNRGQSEVLAQLEKDFAGIDALKAELAPLRDSVPSGTRMPAFVNQLDTLAGANQVTLDGFTVADAVPYAPVTAPVAAGAVVETGSTATPAPTPAAAEPAPTAGLPPVTSAKITESNFASLAVTVTVTGTYSGVLNFVNGLQTGARLVLVSGLVTSQTTGTVTSTETETETGTSTETVSTPGGVTATISGLVYVLVEPAAPTG